MFAYKLSFPCSNNEEEYEALLLGLKAAKRFGIKKLKEFGDFELVIKQVWRENYAEMLFFNFI